MIRKNLRKKFNELIVKIHFESYTSSSRIEIQISE